jgi:cob(I)alamin adenosyltransferase
MTGKSLFTRLGDAGTTGILGPGRYPKSDPRFEALGVLDEANSIIAIIRSMSIDADLKGVLIQIQNDLYRIMTQVSTTRETENKFEQVSVDDVLRIERTIESIQSKLPSIPTKFITPGDTREGAFLDLARTVIRRAERRLVELDQDGLIEAPVMLTYVNRLSSLFFALELQANISGVTTDASESITR